MMFSRISKNKTQTCPKQHAKVILEVDFQKVIRVLKKKKKSEQLYAFIYEYSSLRCSLFKILVACLQRELYYQEDCRNGLQTLTWLFYFW